MASVVDPARAQLITKAYRYKSLSEPGILALYPDARELTIETNLDEAGATALATALFNQTKSFARTFTVTVEDVLFLEDFTTSPNRYVVRFSRHPAGGTSTIYSLITAKIDYTANRTTLTVRG